MGSGSSFSVVHDELIISGGDIVSDEHSNPIADSLSFSGAESHYQTFTGKSIILASTALAFIC